jgi:hypothetical protein
MDIKGLFDGLAKYLDFLIDLCLLQDIGKYAKQSQISPDLVSFFVVGLLVAYLVTAIKHLPGYEPMLKTASTATGMETAAAAQDHTKDPVIKHDMAQFALMSILGALLLHGFLTLWSQFPGTPKLGSVHETLNAVFAYNAFYHPFNALALQSQRGLKALVGINRRTSLFAAGMMFLVAIFYCVTLVYLLHPLAVLHGTTLVQMLWICLAFLATFVVALVAFFLLLGVSPTSAIQHMR